MDAILLFDLKKGCIDCNPAAVQMFATESKEQLLTLLPLELSPEFQPDGAVSSVKVDPVLSQIKETGSALFEWTHKRMDGQKFDASVMATQVRIGGQLVIQGTIRDISEYKQAQEMMIQSEKMLSVGGLAAGMAHEINNPLARMLQTAELIARRLTNSELLDKTFELAGTDFNLKKQYDFKTIKIKKVYGENIPLVPCEGTKIQQVFLNILSNGAQAMQEAKTKAPEFTVRLYVKTKFLCVEIQDNGPGMDKPTRRRVFEPFYTTKPVGVGTGLGLSVSYFIITENHKGQMSVESNPGLGAKFIICLPLNNIPVSARDGK